jgi:hypothetical protein
MPAFQTNTTPSHEQVRALKVILLSQEKNIPARGARYSDDVDDLDTIVARRSTLRVQAWSANWLVRNGYAEAIPSRYSPVYELTEAGKELAKELGLV